MRNLRTKENEDEIKQDRNIKKEFSMHLQSNIMINEHRRDYMGKMQI